MARFNFNSLTLSGTADISKVNENFNKIESNAVLKTDLATTSANGLMSSSDKSKLNGIASGANNTVVDTALSSSSTNPVQNKVVNQALGNKVDKVTGKALSTNDFSNEYKNKLDGIEEGANNITIDDVINANSTNPVQNNTIYQRFNALAQVANTGNYNHLSNTPIYNGGSVALVNNNSNIGSLTVGRIYLVSSLTVNGTNDDKFTNAIVRTYSSDYGICISVLASNNMNQQGYVYYAYWYRNNVWSVASSNINEHGVITGMIIMWSGSTNNIPTGWALCNGQNGTPDLRNRFIVGAGDSYAVGATGGSNTVTLTENQIPSHNHDFDYSTATPNNFANGDCLGGGSSLGAWNYSYTRKSITTDNTGGGQAHENRPPYYALCFIMKT